MPSLRKPELEAYFGIKLTPDLIVRIHEAIEDYLDKNIDNIVKKCVDECIEDVVKKCLEEREERTEEEITKLRKISYKEAVAIIKKYVDKHQGCRTSDIIYELALDPDLVLSVLKKLEKDKVIRGENIESASI